MSSFLDQVVASPELQQELQACENKETLVNRILELANGVSREDIESALKKKKKRYWH
ncbi:Nif11-like leader peptide family natural product precursor (plasmid) [Acaryochloris sp. 'Moss Beach']|uniref:Nif11 family protein n=1 Tax=Acaryochloris sp. 'Moss Beach' TaxID=2740837 RepID=UPI001F25BCFC|nr:Nif11-like leader peptide family natural product precursor [Acaryochloris sp. 'Moss Beach']UJB73336.1 Nif11-like leader peptide family natural product precursor [Acaryochloris sp. 'Moss Beach']